MSASAQSFGWAYCRCLAPQGSPMTEIAGAAPWLRPATTLIVSIHCIVSLVAALVALTVNWAVPRAPAASSTRALPGATTIGGPARSAAFESPITWYETDRWFAWLTCMTTGISIAVPRVPSGTLVAGRIYDHDGKQVPPLQVFKPQSSLARTTLFTPPRILLGLPDFGEKRPRREPREHAHHHTPFRENRQLTRLAHCRRPNRTGTDNSQTKAKMRLQRFNGTSLNIAHLRIQVKRHVKKSPCQRYALAISTVP